jgi:LPXTG-motif cell wall-anchored protein
MPLLELPHWLMIAGALLVIAGFIGLAFRRKNEVETDPDVLPGDLASWKSPQSPSGGNDSLSRA